MTHVLWVMEEVLIRRHKKMLRANSVKLAALAVAMTGFSFAPIAKSQVSEYFVHAGDQTTFFVIQNGEIVRTWGTAGGTGSYQYPFAVRDTIRSMGANEGEIGAEYDFVGNDLGPRYTHPDGPDRTWDGTTDGTYFYGIDGDGDVYRFDDTWSNPEFLFDVGDFGGITYDATNNSLWISQWAGTDVTEYSMGGAVLGSFPVGHSASVALALDPADNTLWLRDRNAAGTYEQWSKGGVLLDRITVPGASSYNGFGGEFRFGGEVAPTTPVPVNNPLALLLLVLTLVLSGALLQKKRIRTG